MAVAASQLPAAGMQPTGGQSCAWPVTQRPSLVQQRSFAAATTAQDYKKRVLYKGRGIQLFRVLVRLKVFQLAGECGAVLVFSSVLPLFRISSFASTQACTRWALPPHTSVPRAPAQAWPA